MAVEEGWDPILTPKESHETQEQKDKRLQIVRDHVKVFGTDEGQRVLEYYKKFTTDIGTYEGHWTKDFALFRDGQNSIVREMSNKLKETKEK